MAGNTRINFDEVAEKLAGFVEEDFWNEKRRLELMSVLDNAVRETWNKPDISIESQIFWLLKQKNSYKKLFDAFFSYYKHSKENVWIEYVKWMFARIKNFYSDI